MFRPDPCRDWEWYISVVFYRVLNSDNLLHATRRSIFARVKTLPRVDRINFFMSSLRTLNPRPAIQAMTSKRGGSPGMRSLILNSPRCWTRVILSRAVPSSSVIFASMTTCGLNSSGMMKSGACRNRLSVLPALSYGSLSLRQTVLSLWRFRAHHRPVRKHCHDGPRTACRGNVHTAAWHRVHLSRPKAADLQARFECLPCRDGESSLVHAVRLLTGDCMQSRQGHVCAELSHYHFAGWASEGSAVHSGQGYVLRSEEPPPNSVL